jgi:DNA polymerase I-like protein with 3'-5' exonuclease and polymerase domains
VLTVHDSIVADVYPGELEKVTEALRWAMVEINSEIKERWGYDMIMPMRIEVSAGINWGSLETINHFG